MIERKQQLFGDDPRGITNECVIVKNGQLTVRAEAQLGTQTAADKNSKISKRSDGARD